MATAWPFGTGTPRKFDLLASGAVPVGLTTVRTETLYIQKIRVLNTNPVGGAMRTISLYDASMEEIIDTIELAPKQIFGEVMDMAPYIGLKVNASGLGLKYRIHGWKGTGTL